MQLLAGLLILSAAFPLGRALVRTRESTLRYPLLWAWSAWLAWLWGVELGGLATAGVPDWLTLVAGCLLGLTPWLGWAALCRRGPAEAEFDRTWLAFRDRYGMVWGQRTREQFNRAAANAGWPV